MANGWALGNFAGEFVPARRLTLRSSNLVYFRLLAFRLWPETEVP